MRALISFAAALTFGLGLCISGMTDPANVRAFLTLGPGFNPSLILVMAGAIATLGLLTFLLGRSKPILATHFRLPQQKHLSLQLIIGSILFGVGWGLVGYCPGPALVSLAGGQVSCFVFLANMLLGMYLHVKWAKIALWKRI